MLSSLFTRAFDRVMAEWEVELARIIYRQVIADLTRSDITNRAKLEAVRERSTSDLEVILGPDVRKRLLSTGISMISDDAWRGTMDQSVVDSLHALNEHLGRPMKVNVSSVDVAACAVICLMKLNGVNIEFQTDDASGREQALRLSSGDTADFAVAADAPMFFTPDFGVQCYLKMLDIHWEEQKLLLKRGDNFNGDPKIFVYPNSSASHHFRVLYERRGELDLSGYRELELELSDYSNLAQVMGDGDLVFAWQPPVRRARGDRALRGCAWK
jgi:hypothetical protein